MKFTMSSNISSTEEPDSDGDEVNLLPISLLVPVLMVITVMIVMAVVGNILVIISYLTDKTLQTVHNMYIFNLAIADLFLGVSSMGLYSVYSITVWHWSLGRVMCKVFLCVDFTLCLQTVLLVMVISLDRLILINTGAQYKTRETRKVGYVKLTVTWFFAFALYGPAILGWDYWVGESTVDDGDCNTEFRNNFQFTIATATVEFFVPFVSIIVLNILVYSKIRKRNKICSQTNEINRRTVPNVMSSTDNPDHNVSNSGRSPSGMNHSGMYHSGRSPSGMNHSGRSPSGMNHSGMNHSGMNHSGMNPSGAVRNKLPRDRKAAKALSLLVIVFAICWTPYTVATIIAACCDTCVNRDFYEFLNWLLWSKSCINPLLYAHTNARFRQNFTRLLSVCVKKRKPIHVQTN